MEKVEVKAFAKDNSSIEIKITGDVSLKYIQKVYSDLQNIKDSYKKYTISYSGINNIDAAGFQLLFAYYNSLQLKKKEICIADNFNEDLKKTLKCVGLLDILYLKK